jgi:hypothetical protein
MIYITKIFEATPQMDPHRFTRTCVLTVHVMSAAYKAWTYQIPFEESYENADTQAPLWRQRDGHGRYWRARDSFTNAQQQYLLDLVSAISGEEVTWAVG